MMISFSDRRLPISLLVSKALSIVKALSDITFGIKSAFDSKSAFRYHFWMQKCKIGAFGSNLQVDDGGALEAPEQGPAYEELGQYLRLLMQGVQAGQALQSVTKPNQDRTVCWTDLKRAATEYLPLLPEDYPQQARQGIVDLVVRDLPPQVERVLDPILDLDQPEVMQRYVRPRPKGVPDPLKPAVDPDTCGEARLYS